ncbi:hypothetical protein HYH03_011251 [Edaphochlamys debaryana]|uniref:Uncharacterized protein n=1 Tax=Edaphochlamys debaryana TaxID=47281 RepID=A0A836BVC5_9CHLO|nr:hypothetical protein HYH03_011251 [Edaphochlamys debaryana]|eukprot:KAG2490300.1 hypothetical protein HYH03_011251 [Edaphochlamys debaryana]
MPQEDTVGVQGPAAHPSGAQAQQEPGARAPPSAPHDPAAAAAAAAGAFTGPALWELGGEGFAALTASSPAVLERWRDAFDAACEDAATLGIPRSALPVLPPGADAAAIRRARDDLEGLVASFLSAALCGPADYFCRYSARAAANANANADGGGNGGSGPAGRVWLDPVFAPAAGRNGTAAACPVAVLVGVDASLDPGLRSPANLLGVIQPSVLGELDQRLAASAATLSAAGCGAPPLIAYSHYPLSTIGYPLFPSAPPPSHAPPSAGASGPGPTRAPRGTTLPAVLMRYGVTAHVSGPLYGAFGSRLHRLHAAPPPAAPEPQDGSRAGAQFGSRPPPPPGSWMLELESVDWKHARALRLLTLDYPSPSPSPPGPEVGAGAGAALCFADLVFSAPPGAGPPASGGSSSGAAGGSGSVGAGGGGAPRLASLAEPGRRPGVHLPLLTCPPDARYSPQLWPRATPPPASPQQGQHEPQPASAAAPSCAAALGGLPANGSSVGGGRDNAAAGAGGPTAVVRALVLPVAPGAGAAPAGWRLRWACEAGRAGEGSGGVDAAGRRPRDPEDGHGPGGGGGQAMVGAAAGRLAGELEVGGVAGGAVAGVEGTSVSPPARTPPAPLRMRTRLPASALPTPMRLESAEGSHSAWVADLLAPSQPEGGGEGESREGARGRAADGGGPQPRDCASGLLTVQVLVPGAPGEPPSASEERPLHWRQPPPSGPPVPSPASAASASASPPAAAPFGDAFWAAPGSGNGAVAASEPAPLGSTLVEWTVLGVRWYPLGLAGFGLQWALALGLLLLAPRAALLRAQRRERQQRGGSGGRGKARRAGRRSGGAAYARAATADEGAAGCSTSVCVGGAAGVIKRSASGGSSGAGGCCGGGGSRAGPADGWGPAAASPLRRAGGYADPATAAGAAAGACGGPPPLPRLGLPLRLWPLCDCVTLAAHPVPWAAVAGFALALGVGPCGWGVVTPWGIVMRPPDGADGGWAWLGLAPSLDFKVMCNFIVAFVWLPTLLFCASLAARWRKSAQGAGAGAGSGAGPRGGGWLRLLSWRQWLALGWIVFADAMMCWKVWAGLGWPAVLVAPGIGWLLPALGVWMGLAWRHVRCA